MSNTRATMKNTSFSSFTFLSTSSFSTTTAYFSTTNTIAYVLPSICSYFQWKVSSCFLFNCHPHLLSSPSQGSFRCLLLGCPAFLQPWNGSGCLRDVVTLRLRWHQISDVLDGLVVQRLELWWCHAVCSKVPRGWGSCLRPPQWWYTLVCSLDLD